MKFLNNLDLTKNELQNAKLQNLAQDPTPNPAAGDAGLVWFNANSDLVRMWDGAAFQTLTNVLESVAGSGAISVSGVSGKSQTISIAAASAGAAGTMSSGDFSKLAAATASNLGSTLVLRDASGNFAAGTITAALTGTASNATQLNNQAASYYLSRTNHTGSQLASTISDFDTQVRTSRLDQMAAPTAAVSVNNQRIISVATPTSGTDAANKSYVDSVGAGLDPKASVRAASTGPVTVTYSATGGTSGRGQITAVTNSIDGVTLAAGDRVLLKNQATGAQNGIWVVTTVGTGANGVWDRATDFDADAEVTSGAFTFVEQGTQGASGWVLSTANPIIIGGSGGTSLAFTQFSGGAAYLAGNGLTLSGQTFAVGGTTGRILVGATTVDIDPGYVGQTSITTLGTIATGTWNATAIAIAKGGTGGTSVATAKTALGFLTRYAVDVGDGAATSITITHNLGTLDVQVALYEKSGGGEVMANVTHATTNTLTLSFTTAPAAAALRCVVIG
jgi:hypothetical protein